MLPSVLIAAAALLSGSAYAAEGGGWDYIYQGDDWQGTCATGTNQSPIDIKTEKLRNVSKNKPIFFINYDKISQFAASSDSHTVQVKPKGPMEIGIYGGGLQGKYILDNIHFHWPAEHTVNGERSLLEAHFVHYKSIYNSTSQATQDPEGLAVLGVLYVNGPRNPELDKIANGARGGGGDAWLDIGKLLPVERTTFYRYRGSLTTPPCTEAVVWTVFNRYMTTTEEQVAAFRSLLPPPNQAVDTYRNTQPLNGRPVEFWTVDENAVSWNKQRPLNRWKQGRLGRFFRPLNLWG